MLNCVFRLLNFGRLIYSPCRFVMVSLLIAALIFSAGYYSAPIFFDNSKNFYNSKNLNCIGALSFYDSKRSIGEVLF